jgi:hypothetical protein
VSGDIIYFILLLLHDRERARKIALGLRGPWSLLTGVSQQFSFFQTFFERMKVFEQFNREKFF